jgi:hypothetical protein
VEAVKSGLAPADYFMFLRRHRMSLKTVRSGKIPSNFKVRMWYILPQASCIEFLAACGKTISGRR